MSAQIADARETAPSLQQQARVSSLGLSGQPRSVFCLELAKRPSLDRLDSALNRLAQRHDILRSRYSETHVHYDPPESAFVPLEHLPAAATHAIAIDALKDTVLGPTDLGTGPLACAAICEVAHESTIFALGSDHIAVDGKSMNILVTELGDLYDDLRLESPGKGYAEFAEAQSIRLRSGWGDQRRRYWQELLGTSCRYPPTLKQLASRNQVSVPLPSNLRSVLKPSLWRKICQTARAHRITPHSFCCFALLKALSRSLDVETPAFCVVTHGRVLEGFDRTVGLFAHGVPVVSPGGSFTPEEIHQQLGASTAHAIPLRGLRLANEGNPLGDSAPTIYFSIERPIDDRVRPLLGGARQCLFYGEAETQAGLGADIQIVLIPSPTPSISFRYDANRVSSTALELLHHQLVSELVSRSPNRRTIDGP